jgi:carbon starvation protein CstA
VPNDTPVTAHRAERTLAYMVASAIGLSILAFVAVIIAHFAGVTAEAFAKTPWPTIIILPTIGLPIGLALLIALIIVSGVRRGREAKDARN